MTPLQHINFPAYSGLRCLMMPYIQGESASVPSMYSAYSSILDTVYISKGAIGFLTIDESIAIAGTPHRGSRSKHIRALHTEAGLRRGLFCWGGPVWGSNENVVLEPSVRILLANNLDASCAIWDSLHLDTSYDGDIGHLSLSYPYSSASFMAAGDVHSIGVFTPHESLPVRHDFNRQFLRIVGSGVYGRESYFTTNPQVPHNE